VNEHKHVTNLKGGERNREGEGEINKMGKVRDSENRRRRK